MITSKRLSSKTLTAAVTALALSSQAIGFASSASAYDRGGYGGYGYDRRFDGPRDFDRRGVDRRGDFNRRDFDRRGDFSRRDIDRRPQHVEVRKRDRTARNIAIGLGAFMLGAIIASEASRR